MDDSSLLVRAQRACGDLGSGATDRVEVFFKTSRTRTFVSELGHRGVVHGEEDGWAVRTQRGRRVGFEVGTGALPARPPELLDGAPRFLPGDEPAPSSVAGLDVPDRPLLSEGAGLTMLRTIEALLSEEVPGARLLRARLEDGVAESALAATSGRRAAARYRLATLRLHAVARGREAVWTGLGTCASEIGAQAAVRRLGDLLVIAERGTAGRARNCSAVLAADVGAALLEALAPLFVGAPSWEFLRDLAGDPERFGARGLHLVDDGQLPGGPLSAAADGEGVATGRVDLVRDGRLLQPLLSRLDEPVGVGERIGCRLRPSFRDLPRTSPTHLMLESESPVSVRTLLRELQGGLYFVETTGPVRLHPGEHWVRVPVCGFEVRGGRAVTPVAGVEVHLALDALFQSIRAMGGDVRLRARRGCVGAPSLLLDRVDVLPV